MYYGNNEIGKLYYSDNEIGKAYLGDALVYESDGSTPPTPPIPYITTGLDHWWDGEWNSAINVHDSNSASWIDLIGSANMSLIGDAYFDTNCLTVPTRTRTNGATMTELSYSNTNVTIEIVCQTLVSSKVQGVFSFQKLVNRFTGFAFRANNTFNFYDGGPYASTTPNVISHYACAFNGNVIYKNGVQVSTTNSGMTLTQNRCGVNFYNSTNDYHLNAKVYCIRLYNRVLSSSEVASNYAVDAQRFGIS